MDGGTMMLRMSVSPSRFLGGLTADPMLSVERLLTSETQRSLKGSMMSRPLT